MSDAASSDPGAVELVARGVPTADVGLQGSFATQCENLVWFHRFPPLPDRFLPRLPQRSAGKANPVLITTFSKNKRKLKGLFLLFKKHANPFQYITIILLSPLQLLFQFINLIITIKK